MRRSALFLGAIIIFVGVLLLLEALGIITFNVWGLIIPVFVIALGAWILWGTLAHRSVKTEHVNVPLEGAARARIRIQHGAGRLEVGAGAETGSLLVGDCNGGVELDTRRIDDKLEVSLSVLNRIFPFIWGPENLMDWKLNLAQDVPLALSFDTGATDTHIDLSRLNVTQIRLNSGASSTRITLPANAGKTIAEFKTGAASLEVLIPPGVAARIQASGGLSTVQVDRNRFPRSGNVYQSADYEIAANKVELRVEMGVGSVGIR
jgi:hypothetical protein